MDKFILMCKRADNLQEEYIKNYPCKYYGVKPNFMDAIYLESGDLRGVFHYGVNGFTIGEHYHKDICSGIFWKINHGCVSSYSLAGAKGVFIPRQDQLQEIYAPNLRTATFWSMVWVLMSKAPESYYYNKFNSDEQLWLAFVMAEKYNKTWNGKDWINEKE